MQSYAPSLRPQTSPWGNVERAEQILSGIWSVSTASHGGLILSEGRQKAMPASLALEGSVAKIVRERVRSAASWQSSGRGQVLV